MKIPVDDIRDLPANMTPLLTRPQVAAFLQIDEDRIASLVATGKLPPPITQLGPRSQRWRLSDLQEWLADQP